MVHAFWLLSLRYSDFSLAAPTRGGSRKYKQRLNLLDRTLYLMSTNLNTEERGKCVLTRLF